MNYFPTDAFWGKHIFKILKAGNPDYLPRKTEAHDVPYSRFAPSASLLGYDVKEIRGLKLQGSYHIEETLNIENEQDF